MPDGRLLVDAFITKPGIFEYADPSRPGGIRRELRDDSEVYSPRTMQSFQQIPVTHEHPPQMLNADNAKYYMVGSTGDRVQRMSPGNGEPDHLATSVMVADRPTIDALESGDVEVSCGYGCEIDETPGVHPVYGKYDVAQRAITGNHLAVAVGRGRAGRTARVRMDAELTADERNKLRDSQFAVPETGQLPIHDAEHVRGAMARFNQTDFPSAAAKKTAYSKIVAAAKRFGVDSSNFEKEYGARMDAVPGGNRTMADEDKTQQALATLGAKLKEAEARADKAESDLADAQKRADVADGIAKQHEKTIGEMRTQLATRVDASETAALTAMRERAEKAEQAVTRFDSRFDAAVRQRVGVITKAKTFLGEEFRFDDLSERQIMAAVVTKLDSSADVSTKVTDGVIEGQFIALTSRADAYARSLARASEVIQQQKVEQPRKDAKSESTEKLRNMWREPLPNDIRAQHARGGKES